MNQSAFDIIPRPFRRRSYGVVATIFGRAVLNFAGLAVLLPILALILDTEGIRSNRYLAALYHWGGFTNDHTFILGYK